MALPGFNAASSVYPSRGRYLTPAPATTPPAGLTPAWDAFCDGRELNANYSNPNDCGSYISCDYSGSAVVMRCPAGLHYTEGTRPWGHCDYPELVDCKA